MRKAILTLISACAVAICASAADGWSYGMTVGYENSGLTWKVGDESLSVNTVSGFSIGAIVDYDVCDYFGVETGVKFSMNGFAMAEPPVKIMGYTYPLELKCNLYYIGLPIYAIGHLPVGQVDILLEVGPNLMYGVASQMKVQMAGYEVASADAFKESFKPFNCSIHLGAGAQIAGARLMVGYNFGVYDISREEIEANDVKTGGFFVSASYLF